MNLLLIKLFGLSVVVVLAGAAGFRYGAASRDSEVNDALNKAIKISAAWDAEKARLNADALVTLKKAVADVQAEEAAKRQLFTKAEANYRNTIKELQDEKNRLLNTASTSGLWAQSTSCGPDTSNTGSDYTLRSVTPSKPAAILWCKLSEKTSSDLIELVTDADKVVASYNECVDKLNADRNKVSK